MANLNLICAPCQSRVDTLALQKCNDDEEQQEHTRYPYTDTILFFECQRCAQSCFSSSDDLKSLIEKRCQLVQAIWNKTTPEVFDQLMDLKTIHCPFNQQFLFRTAVRAGHTDLVSYFISLSQIDPSYNNNEALTFCCIFGHADILSFLLETTKVKKKLSICHLFNVVTAIMNNNINCADVLIEQWDDLKLFTKMNRFRIEDIMDNPNLNQLCLLLFVHMNEIQNLKVKPSFMYNHQYQFVVDQGHKRSAQQLKTRCITEQCDTFLPMYPLLRNILNDDEYYYDFNILPVDSSSSQYWRLQYYEPEETYNNSNNNKQMVKWMQVNKRKKPLNGFFHNYVYRNALLHNSFIVNTPGTIANTIAGRRRRHNHHGHPNRDRPFANLIATIQAQAHAEQEQEEQEQEEQ